MLTILAVWRFLHTRAFPGPAAHPLEAAFRRGNAGYGRGLGTLTAYLLGLYGQSWAPYLTLIMAAGGATSLEGNLGFARPP